MCQQPNGGVNECTNSEKGTRGLDELALAGHIFLHKEAMELVQPCLAKTLDVVVPVGHHLTCEMDPREQRLG